MRIPQGQGLRAAPCPRFILARCFPERAQPIHPVARVDLPAISAALMAPIDVPTQPVSLDSVGFAVPRRRQPDIAPSAPPPWKTRTVCGWAAPIVWESRLKTRFERGWWVVAQPVTHCGARAMVQGGYDDVSSGSGQRNRRGIKPASAFPLSAAVSFIAAATAVPTREDLRDHLAQKIRSQTISGSFASRALQSRTCGNGRAATAPQRHTRKT